MKWISIISKILFSGVLMGMTHIVKYVNESMLIQNFDSSVNVINLMVNIIMVFINLKFSKRCTTNNNIQYVNILYICSSDTSKCIVPLKTYDFETVERLKISTIQSADNNE